MADSPLRAVALIRMSTLAQEASPERQREGFRAYCQQWHLEPVAECLEEGVSATHTDLADRPGVAELMALAKKRRMDVVWAEEPSRIARKPEDWFAIRAALGRYGVAIVGPRDDPAQAHDTAISEFTQGLLAILARFEARQLGERMHRAQRVHVAAGRFRGGRLAMGFRWVADPAPGHYAEDPEAAETVRVIYRAYADGMGKAAISHLLNERGLPSYTGGKWYISTVCYMLENPAYRGHMTYAGDTYPTTLPPIVPPEVLAAVDERLASNRLRPQRAANATTRALFAGLLRCPECGHWLGVHAITRHLKSGKVSSVYYACNRARNAPLRCDWRKMVSEKRLEDVVLPLLADMLRTSSHRTRLPKQEARQLRDVAQERAALERERERVIGLHVRGRLAEEEADALLDGVAQRLSALDEREPAPAAHPVTLAELRAAMTVLRKHWPRMTVAERRKLLQALVVAITPDIEDLRRSQVEWR